nr:PREDICTED: zinc finger protein 2 homolog [Camelus bactrianus]
MREKMHMRNKPWESDQKKKSHRQIEEFIQHQNSALEQLLEYNNGRKAFHRKTAFVICKRAHTGEEPSQSNKCRRAFLQKLKLSACPRALRERKPHKSSKNGKSSCMNSKHVHQRARRECCKLGKSFSKRANHSQHQRLHTGGKPEDYKQSEGALQKSPRRQSGQTRTREKIHDCNECGKSFPENPCLTQHQGIHTVEDPRECNDSEGAVKKESHPTLNQSINMSKKSFKGSKGEKSSHEKLKLTQHQRTQSGEQNDESCESGRVFTEKSHLTWYQRVHNGKKTYNCNKCAERFHEKRPHSTSECTHRKSPTKVVNVEGPSL